MGNVSGFVDTNRNVAISFGPAGATEQDDMNNFIQCTATARTMAGRNVPMNVQLGVGKDSMSEVMPGKVSPSPSETNQRSFYARWAEVMDAPSWKDISVEKPSFKEPSAVN